MLVWWRLHVFVCLSGIESSQSVPSLSTGFHEWEQKIYRPNSPPHRCSNGKSPQVAKRYISCLPNTRFILSQAIKWNCSLCSLVSNVWAVLTVDEFMLIWFKLWSNYFPYQFQVVDQLSMISSRIVWFWSAASSFQ